MFYNKISIFPYEREKILKLTIQQIHKHFENSIALISQNKIGVEYEIFCFHKDTLDRLAYDSDPGIQTILHHIQQQTNSQIIQENNNTIALKNKDYSITLEPGGQLEASFLPCTNLLEFQTKLDNYLAILQQIQMKYPIIFIAMGVDPFHTLDEIPWMPKQRYKIMRKYFAQFNDKSHCMMKQTAAIQINIDYNSEQDAIYKYNTALHIHPTLVPLTSNTPLYENAIPNPPYYRSYIWQNTCTERTGHHPIQSFQDYIDYALDIPMFFICRENQYIAFPTKTTFRQYLEYGFQEYTATYEDWILHLNTIFTAVRFNNKTLEIRIFDSHKPKFLLAYTALVQSLFYTSPQQNLQGKTLSELLDIAHNNLPKQEQHYLLPLYEVVEQKKQQKTETIDAQDILQQYTVL